MACLWSKGFTFICGDPYNILRLNTCPTKEKEAKFYRKIFYEDVYLNLLHEPQTQ